MIYILVYVHCGVISDVIPFDTKREAMKQYEEIKETYYPDEDDLLVRTFDADFKVTEELFPDWQAMESQAEVIT